MTPPAVSGAFSGLPLSSLPVVILDTETTGLDTVRDRVIEFGAVRVKAGVIVDDGGFSQLVNPGVAIPVASTAVHNITDDDVRDSKTFPEVARAYRQWAGEHALIGYSIGFDLAVLKAEFARHGMEWRAPRSLDVRHLVHLLAPELPSESLETAAGWLGIEVKDRHRALADATITANVFIALIPKLRARGINTLAEAERACLRLATRLSEEAAAGWHDVVHSDRLVPADVMAFARIDSFPYRHRVSDIMSKPPAIADNKASLSSVLEHMMKAKISSMFLEAEKPDGARGIITERDILRAIDADGAAALKRPVSTYATRPLIAIEGEEFVYRAISRMAAKGYRHLAVTGDAGDLAGALSARDLLKQRASDALSLGESIEQAQSSSELGLIWSELTTVARGLVHEDVVPHDIAAVISRELRGLTKRACQLAEKELAEAGKGAPPAPYAMMVLGSGGRGESLLAMDQDNAIIFDKGDPGGETDQWFEALGKRVADILNEAGVAYCNGGVMASNAAWRMDTDRWRKMIGSWITRSRPEDILSSDIFFDAAAVHGEFSLADELREDALEAAAGAANFTKTLAIKAGEFNVPLGMFGRFKLENGRVDLKKGGLMPIFSAARVAALKKKVAARATPVRLMAIRGDKSVNAASVDNLIAAHRTLLGTVLRQQLRDIDRGIKLSNLVATAELSGHEREELKWALEQVSSVRDLLGLPTFG